MKLLQVWMSWLAWLAAGVGIMLFGYVWYVLPVAEAAPALQISTKDSALVARGQYLAVNVLACNQCHATRDFLHYSGPIVPGTLWRGAAVPDYEQASPGVLFAPNLTPFTTAAYTDGQIYRLLTTGITNKGEPVHPAMPYNAMGRLDPHDVQAVIAFLRTLPKVPSEGGKSDVRFPLNMQLRIMPHRAKPLRLDSMATPLLQGYYLTQVAGCGYCHSPVNNLGQIVQDSLFAGGHRFMLDGQGKVYSANLTPAKTGLGTWTEAKFVERFARYRNADSLAKMEPCMPNTVMAWSQYAGMQDKDLRAIYQYLNSIKPVEHTVPAFEPSDNN